MPTAALGYNFIPQQTFVIHYIESDHGLGNKCDAHLGYPLTVRTLARLQDCQEALVVLFYPYREMKEANLHLANLYKRSYQYLPIMVF